MPQRKFKNLFCARYGCLPEKYRKRALGKCLHWHARLLAPVLLFLDARFFDRDLTMVHDLGNARDWRGVEEVLEHFRFRNSDNHLTWHADCRLMVCESKVRALADLLFDRSGGQDPIQNAPPTTPPPEPPRAGQRPPRKP